MNRPLAPGLYRQPAQPQRAVRQLVRADVPVFLGYTLRGPVGEPVRLRTLNQFDELFGGGPGFLWHGIKGFFESGGDAVYVVRLAAPSATAASIVQAAQPVSWQASASFAWTMIDPRTLAGRDLPGAQPWISLFEQVTRKTGNRSPDAGAWGNLLTLSVSRTALVRTETLPDVVLDAGRSFMVTDLTGLEAASILQLSQRLDGETVTATIVPEAIDPARQIVTFDDPVMDIDTGGPAFDPTRPIRLESVEFDFDVALAGQITTSFRGLSPHPDHSRNIADTFARESRDLHFGPVVQFGSPSGAWQVQGPDVTTATLARADWTDPALWPAAGHFQLAGGVDGLQDLETGDYLAALAGVARISEAALIAAPDLVMQPSLYLGGDTFSPTITDCHDLTPPPENYLNGIVTGVDAAGTETPLASATVDPAGLGKTVRTDARGRFTLSGLTEGLVTLRLSRAGYEDLEFLSQTSRFTTTDPVTIAMSPLTQPRVFGRDAIQTVQTAMANPAIVGPYKVAILDMPAPDDTLQNMLTWRARLGDQPRAALVGPWLAAPTDTGITNVPASCHLCGATAAAEHTIGVHRSGANIRLRHVEGVTLPIDDTAHGILNTAQITVMQARPGQGIRAGGARSLAADPSLLYLSTRRILDVLERTLQQVLQPLVFEPNNLFTRQAIIMTATSLLTRMWQIGALAGPAPEQAFTVKCDLENNPDESRAAGRLILDIGVAPTIPMEFIFFRLGHQRDITKVTEGAT